jgi:UDP-N-acetyl-D-mannosaminuronic acid dehydrogenase
MTFADNVAVIGGCGRVGLPLAVALADRGLRTVAVDIDAGAVEVVNQGLLPFLEPGADHPLKEAVNRGLLRATTDPAEVSQAEHLILVIGTSVDEHLNPDLNVVSTAVATYLPHLRSGPLLILRSTVYPGVTRVVEGLIREAGIEVDVAFCPERIAEGKAMEELFSLPQIVAARGENARDRAIQLFRHLTSKVVLLEPEEAELAKLFTNTWRYIKFAIANQLFIIANEAGLDYERIRTAIREDYPRAADLPGAGFAAGPCLLKDTMQLAAFNNNNFNLGHSAMLINEGLPLYLVDRLARQYPLSTMTVGILGMAFKADSDDIRSSLSYKLKRLLEFRASRVLCTDPYVEVDNNLIPLDELLPVSDLLIIGAPHRIYAELETGVPIVDIWNARDQGVLV